MLAVTQEYSACILRIDRLITTIATHDAKRAATHLVRVRRLVSILCGFHVGPDLVGVKLQASAVGGRGFGGAGGDLAFALLHLQYTRGHIRVQLPLVRLLLPHLFLALVRQDVALAEAGHRFVAVGVQDVARRLVGHED